jgi:hypothetical protein
MEPVLQILAAYQAVVYGIVYLTLGSGSLPRFTLNGNPADEKCRYDMNSLRSTLGRDIP